MSSTTSSYDYWNYPPNYYQQSIEQNTQKITQQPDSSPYQEQDFFNNKLYANCDANYNERYYNYQQQFYQQQQQQQQYNHAHYQNNVSLTFEHPNFPSPKSEQLDQSSTTSSPGLHIDLIKSEEKLKHESKDDMPTLRNLLTRPRRSLFPYNSTKCVTKLHRHWNEAAKPANETEGQNLTSEQVLGLNSHTPTSIISNQEGDDAKEGSASAQLPKTHVYPWMKQSVKGKSYHIHNILKI